MPRETFLWNVPFSGVTKLLEPGAELLGGLSPMYFDDE
jgi:hypothetical protein